MTCALVKCQSALPGTVQVKETIADGTLWFATEICEACAGVLGVSDGDTLPSDTNECLQEHYMLSDGWQVGDPTPTDPRGTADARLQVIDGNNVSKT